MFGQEKFMEQPVNLQQAFAIDVHAIAFNGQEPPVGNALERLRQIARRGWCRIYR